MVVPIFGECTYIIYVDVCVIKTRQNIFHDWLSTVRWAFKSHRKTCIFVFTKRCNNGTQILIFFVKLKGIVLNTNLRSRFAKNLYHEGFLKKSNMIGKGYYLYVMTLLSWHKSLIKCTNHPFWNDEARWGPFTFLCWGQGHQSQQDDLVHVWKCPSAHKGLHKVVNEWVLHWVLSLCIPSGMDKLQVFHWTSYCSPVALKEDLFLLCIKVCQFVYNINDIGPFIFSIKYLVE